MVWLILLLLLVTLLTCLCVLQMILANLLCTHGVVNHRLKAGVILLLILSSNNERRLQL